MHGGGQCRTGLLDRIGLDWIGLGWNGAAWRSAVVELRWAMRTAVLVNRSATTGSACIVGREHSFRMLEGFEFKGGGGGGGGGREHSWNPGGARGCVGCCYDERAAYRG